MASETDGAQTVFVVDKNRQYAQVLEERDGTGSLTVSYVYGDDLISQQRGINTFHYLYDGQLSTRALSNDAEDITDTYTYDAFGVILDQAGTTQNNYRYTGEQFDPNVGFYYLRARYYDQSTGRFVTTDPYQGRMHEPVTLHKYIYGNGNPVMYSDPSGYTSLSIGSAMTALGIAAGILSALNHWSYYHLYDNVAGVTNYTLRFQSGMTAGAGFFLGSVFAVMKGYNNRYEVKEKGVFRIFLFGMGVGAGYTFYSDTITINLPVRTKIYQFKGWGSITAIDFGIYMAGISVSAITLPNGYKIKPDNAGFSVEASVGFTLYSVVTYWDYIGQNADDFK